MQDKASNHVVIVGGGLAGVACAKRLADDNLSRITLIDANGYEQFQPLLYQVATAELASRDMVFHHVDLFRKDIGPHRHELHGRLAFASWLGVHAELLANAGAELKAFVAWAEDFYFRPHHRSAELLDPAQVEIPKIKWDS